MLLYVVDVMGIVCGCQENQVDGIPPNGSLNVTIADESGNQVREGFSYSLLTDVCLSFICVFCINLGVI